MATPVIGPPMTETSDGLGISRVLAVLRRRRALAIVLFAFIFVAAVSLAFFLPNVWTTQAVILVDPEQVPDAFVKTAAPADRERQVMSLTQQVLSRPRLEEVVSRIYRMRTPVPSAAVERMRRDIRIDLIGEDAASRASGRSNLVAFSVAFRATDPRLAATVANQLASFFVDENTRIRERQASTTSDVLDTQLTELRTKLAAQERLIADYKEKHLGDLPEQRDANQRTLDRLQSQLQFAQENSRRAVERRDMLARTLAEVDQGTRGPDVGLSSSITPAKLAAARASLLRQELTAAETKYGSNDPRVARLREQLSSYEAGAASPATTAKPQARALAPERKSAPENPYIVSLMTQLDAAKIEAKTLTQDIAAINQQIGVYQRRIESTPQRERELAQLMHDYDSVREMLRTLVARRGEVQIATDFEHKRKGETFRIIEAAAVPDMPTGPSRMRLFLIGLMAAVGASALGLVIAEQLDSSYRSPEEMRAAVSVPVVSAIPSIRTDKDRLRARQRRLVSATAVGICLMLVVGLASIIAHENTALVSLLTPASTPRR